MNSKSKSKNKTKQKYKGELENIKSDYILKIILEYLKRNKLLKIIKCNKKIQKRLDKSINDYKEYPTNFHQ